MLRVLWTAMRYFLAGLIIGYLTAPRPGVQTRRLIVEHLGAMLREVFGIAAEGEEEAVTRIRRAQP